jgi:hypothetical protein
MDAGSTAYAGTLRAAIDAAETSRRRLSFRLAARKGTKQESEYRSLGRYLKGQEMPEPEQAAILAVELGEPLLALVTPVGERRRVRRATVETLVGQNTASIEALREAVQILLRQVVALGGTAEGIPKDALPQAVEGNDS